MSIDEVESPMFRQLRSTFRQALHDFTEAQASFRILHSTAESTPSTTKTLYVLDSSFNPPTKAHALLARNAIARDHGEPPVRLLLLLATQNADKQPKPATNEDRLALMALMARQIEADLPRASTVDVGVTDKPFFMDKALAIDQSGIYAAAQQVHLTGFDTITRIFDSKYYPPDQQLRVLNPFLDHHRLRVTYRLGDKYGTQADQDHYVDTISDGSRESEGMKSQWRQQVELTDDAKDGQGISSTAARRCCVDGRPRDLDQYVSVEVASYIREMKLYQNPGDEKK